MIAFTAAQLLPAAGYLLLFMFAIYKLPLFSDAHLGRKHLTTLFFLKSLAVPVFFLAYQQRYGGIELLDAGKFYNDAKMVNACAYEHPGLFLRMIFGLQDDTPRSNDFYQCFIRTYNWDNGVLKDYLYNDNRIIIRVHSLLHFISFNSYFVQALFSCLFSFAGLFFLYKSLKENFEGKWIWLLAIPCLFPALWFHTGALSKEGLACFVLGCSAYEIKRLVTGNSALIRLPWLGILLCLSVLLKPYLLLPWIIIISCFFLIENSGIRRKVLVFLGVLFLSVIILNIFSLVFRDRSLAEAAGRQQRVFSGMSEGGIFLSGGSRFIRLDFDDRLVNKVPGTDSSYKISKGAAFSFWEDAHNKDTLYCSYNDDTSTVYHLEFAIAPSTSNIPLRSYGSGLISSGATSIYYSLFHPLFFNAAGSTGLLASLENLLIIAALIVIVIGLFRTGKPALLPIAFFSFALTECLLIGFAAPNLGAIFRYRAPAVIFILLAALYCLAAQKRTTIAHEGESSAQQ